MRVRKAATAAVPDELDDRGQGLALTERRDAADVIASGLARRKLAELTDCKS